MKKIVALFTVLVMMLCLSGCSHTLYRYQKVYVGAFDTVITISGFSENKKSFDETADEIYAILEEYSRLFDIYSEYEGIENLCSLNRDAKVSPVSTNERITELLVFAKDIFYLTDSNVNAALGSVLSIWHEKREEAIDAPEKASLPEMGILEEAAIHTDIEKIITDKENNTVFIEDPELFIDVGAVAKGYAVEKAAKAMELEGLSGWVINAGGNVRTIGEKADGGKWNVGITKPFSDSENEITLKIGGGLSVVTSGSYQRYYIVNGKNYNHIIDPGTLFPAEKYLSVTVVTSDSGLADALSTALFIMDIDEGKTLLEKFPDAEAFWILPDGTRDETEGFGQYK